MKIEPKWKSEYIHEVSSVELSFDLIVVYFETSEGKKKLTLKGKEGVPLAHQFLSECYEIRIFDRNQFEGNSLEFGRWKVEIWDEDNPYSEFYADTFEIESEPVGI